MQNKEEPMHKQKNILIVKTKYLLYLLPIFLLIIVLAPSKSSAKSERFAKVSGLTYTYKIDKNDTAYVIKISWPLRRKKVTTVKIPKKLGGKVVTCIGNKDYEGGSCFNVFGVYEADDLLMYPNIIYKATKNIKKIVIPDTVNCILGEAINNLPKGITINIPRDLEDGYKEYIWTKWKKVTCSRKCKNFSVKNDLLLSANGKKCFQYMGNDKKINIPYGVEVICEDAFEYAKYKQISIPSTVKKIQEFAFGRNKNAKVIFSSANKYFTQKNGCIYRNKDKSLAIMMTKTGKVKIPKGVKKIPDGIGCFGKFKEIKFPKSLKVIYGDWKYYLSSSKKLKCIFTSKNPPKVKGMDISAPNLIVPKGSREKYKKGFYFNQ